MAAKTSRAVDQCQRSEGPAAFRKTFSRIAPDSDVWFSTEPDLIVELRSAKLKR